MRVPKIFYGEYQKVKAEVRKVVTKLVKGIPIDEIFGALETIESEDYPQALFWLNRSWSQIGKQPHFPLCVMSEAIFQDARVTRDFLRVQQASIMSFFGRSPWGTIILNSSQIYDWAVRSLEGYTLEPDLASYILEGTLRFWDEFIAMGKRFFWGGQEGGFYFEAFPLCYFVVARCGVDTSEFPLGQLKAYPPPPAFGDLKKIILKHNLVDRMRRDADFREQARKGALYRPK